MSAITVEELVQIAARTQPVTDEECGTCSAEAGEPCTQSCDSRGEAAKDKVADRIGDLPRADFENVLRSALEREARGDEAPGFFWVWWAVDAEAEARGMSTPVGI
ncbi:hypothetical protein ABZ682_22930 [Streptomyces griseoviridis]|uniref:hypothetical protein n=1 Tax=Streptomyces griseoviridis TaxID=45398 RepID=UPI003407A9C4